MRNYVPENPVTIVKFYNFTDSDFTWKWADVPYTFKAGTTMAMEDWKAEHFAKHLADRILTDKKLRVDDETRGEYLSKAIISIDSEPVASSQAATVIVNENLSNAIPVQVEPVKVEPVRKFCNHCDSKGVKHKKDCLRTHAAAI